MLELHETASRALHPRHCSPPVATLTVPWQKAVSHQHPHVPPPPASPQQRAAPCSRWDGPFINGMGIEMRCGWRNTRETKTGRGEECPHRTALGAAGNRIPAALSAHGIILSLIFPAAAALGLTSPTLGCLRSLALLRTCSPWRRSVPSRTLCSMAWQCSGSSNADLIKNLHGAEYAFC